MFKEFQDKQQIVLKTEGSEENEFKSICGKSIHLFNNDQENIQST